MKNIVFIFALFFMVGCSDNIDLEKNAVNDSLVDITSEIRLKGGQLVEDQITNIQQDLLNIYIVSGDFSESTLIEKTVILKKDENFYLRTIFSNEFVATSLIDINQETGQITYL